MWKTSHCIVEICIFCHNQDIHIWWLTLSYTNIKYNILIWPNTGKSSARALFFTHPLSSLVASSSFQCCWMCASLQSVTHLFNFLNVHHLLRLAANSDSRCKQSPAWNCSDFEKLAFFVRHSCHRWAHTSCNNIHNTLLLHFSVKLNLFMNRDFNLCRVHISSFLQTNLILGYSSTEGPSLCVV